MAEWELNDRMARFESRLTRIETKLKMLERTGRLQHIEQVEEDTVEYPQAAADLFKSASELSDHADASDLQPEIVTASFEFETETDHLLSYPSRARVSPIPQSYLEQTIGLKWAGKHRRDADATDGFVGGILRLES